MKEYLKPLMMEEKLMLEDVISVSNQGETENGEESPLANLFGGNN